MKPLCIDLFCGLGGWTEGFLAEGYTVIGFDNHRHEYGEAKYPGQLVIQDVLTIHGSQFKDAAVIVASPPCQNYSYLAMPWSRSTNPDNSKAAKALRLKWETEGPDNRLFDACFRIQREAIEAKADKCGCWETHDGWCCKCCYIPLIVENVRGAIPWVGRSAWNYGSFHLWGDVPALMPINLKSGVKLGGGRSWTGKNGYGSPDYKPFGFNTENEKDWRDSKGRTSADRWIELVDGQKVPVYSDPRRNGGKGVHLTSPRENLEGTKQAAGNGDWFSKEARVGGSSAALGSKSSARKAASAQIAKIPFPLSSHIAQVYYPRVCMTCTTCEDGRKPVLNGLCTNPACEFHPPARPPASGSAMYLQRGNYPEFNCPWCGKPVQPFSKTQATCGVMGCSEKQRVASREKNKLARK